MKDKTGTLPKCYGIIPARYQSERFPGKPMADIQGKPMFWHVFQRAVQCRYFSETVLATDDERIHSAAQTLKVPVVMTGSHHPSGTDRVLEAATLLGAPDDAVVVNIQGDEPLLEPDMLDGLIAPFASREIHVATLAREISGEEAENPDLVKVVMNADGCALYFSRSRIPYPRRSHRQMYYGHIGLYAFRMETLRVFQKLGPGRLETIESLEQLRLLENGIDIRVVVTEHESIGVDTPDDLKWVVEKMKKDFPK